MEQPRFQSLIQIQEQLQTGSLKIEAVVEYYLDRIETTKDLNIYVEVFAEEARQRAFQLDQKRKEQPENLGRLHGMVISIKDVLCYKDHKVTAGSRILENFESLFSATAIQRLLEEDVIIIGRVNCDEFAMGSSNENSFYGPTKNGIDPTKVPGGSSGASAVAVQVDTCLCSLGTDTGGSVRQPAAFCGVMGFKPTYGRISRYGLLAYGSSFDQIGILAHNTKDIALLLELMAGSDAFDSTASKKEVPAFSKLEGYSGQAKIAYFPSAVDHPSMDPEVKAATKEFMKHLEANGHQLEEVDFKYLDYIIPAYYVLTTAEASTNLSRYDGIRFGYRSPNAKNLEETYKKSRTEGFGTEVKRRIILGTFVLSSGYYDAYYTKAQKVRRLIQEQTKAIFENYDFILMPAAPSTAWPIGEKVDDPVAMYLADIFTVQANMVGIPAMAFPIDQHSNGLPIGMQLMADSFEEEKLLGFIEKIKGLVTTEIKA